MILGLSLAGNQGMGAYVGSRREGFALSAKKGKEAVFPCKSMNPAVLSHQRACGRLFWTETQAPRRFAANGN